MNRGERKVCPVSFSFALSKANFGLPLYWKKIVWVPVSLYARRKLSAGLNNWLYAFKAIFCSWCQKFGRGDRIFRSRPLAPIVVHYLLTCLQKRSSYAELPSPKRLSLLPPQINEIDECLTCSQRVNWRHSLSRLCAPTCEQAFDQVAKVSNF